MINEDDLLNAIDRVLSRPLKSGYVGTPADILQRYAKSNYPSYLAPWVHSVSENGKEQVESDAKRIEYWPEATEFNGGKRSILVEYTCSVRRPFFTIILDGGDSIRVSVDSVVLIDADKWTEIE
jgi:hypothetical protein